MRKHSVRFGPACGALGPIFNPEHPLATVFCQGRFLRFLQVAGHQWCLRHSGIHIATAADVNGEAAIMTHTERMSKYHPAVRPRTVAIVSGNPEHHVVQTVLGAVDHDVVLVEATSHAYSHIKHIRPDLVILCMASDDSEGCQLLSMLTLDRETSCIPVVTHVIHTEDTSSNWDNPRSHAVMPVTAAALN